MIELNTLPASVRTRLERAEALLSQNRPDQAQVIYSEIGRELAKTHPEICGLLVAAQMGFRQLSYQEIETSECVKKIPIKNWRGKVIGLELQRVAEVTTKEKRWKLS